MMLEEKLIIKNKLGLHARAAAKLVDVANRFSTETIMTTKDKTASCKSIIDVMMLGASQGTEFMLSAEEGEDAEDAFNAVRDLINNRFGEKE